MTTHELNREASIKFGMALLAELGVDVKNVSADGVTVENIGGYGGKVHVTWQGVGWIDFTRFQEILHEVQA